MNKLNLWGFGAAICLLAGHNLKAQDTILVEPGLGTIESAIAKDGGDVIYKLSAGEKYLLESVVNVDDESMGTGQGLVIIGEETDGMPPVIQVGKESVGSAFPALFQIYNNLTLKNVFLAAQEETGAAATGVILINGQVELIIDNCVIDPAGIKKTFDGDGNADKSSFYLTNSLIMNNGSMSGPDDSGWLGTMAWDTLWVENNTFVSSGQEFIGTAAHNIPNNSFIWVNHNTFLWHDVWIKRSCNDQNFFFTNNLLHDISIYAHQYDWALIWPDYKQGNHMLSLACIDTMVIDAEGTLETLPSERKFFWEYNLQYNSPQLLELPRHAVDSGYEPLYLIPMLWEEDTPIEYTGGIEVVSPADSSREYRILADDTNWPHMKYDNNWYDKDPLYTDSQIYSTNDSMIQNVMGWYGFLLWREYPTYDGTPSYKFEVDKWAGTDPEDYPQVWPRFDGTYSNPELLTASIEGLPLGDLNWFPDDKARWEAEKFQIQEHILALNEQRYELGPGVGIQDLSRSVDLSIYPNPVHEILHISVDRKLIIARVFDVTGSLVKEKAIEGLNSTTLDVSHLNPGIYLLEIQTLSGERHAVKLLKN